jgi:hypothetical protein
MGKTFVITVDKVVEINHLGRLEPGTRYAWDEDSMQVKLFQMNTGYPLEEANFTDPAVHFSVEEKKSESEEAAKATKTAEPAKTAKPAKAEEPAKETKGKEA